MIPISIYINSFIIVTFSFQVLHRKNVSKSLHRISPCGLTRLALTTAD